jgi:glycosyltransferase involved in cell wall biosynthesis
VEPVGEVRRLVAVIPTRNEEDSIAAVVAEVREAAARLAGDVRILVVDDSQDGTRAAAARAGAEVLSGGGVGLGTAMFRGLRVAASLDPDVIVSIDGDGQADVTAELARFVEPVSTGLADLVVGSRFASEGLVHYSYRWRNRLGTRFLVHLLRRQTGLPLTDSHGGIRAMHARVARELELLGTHTYVQESIIDAVEKGYRVIEIPSAWRPRRHGSSRVVRSIPRYVFYTLPVLLLRSGSHIRWLYSSGILVTLGGLGVFGAVLIQEGFTYQLGHRLPALTLTALAITTGLQLFFFGFVLQLLKQIKRAADR